MRVLAAPDKFKGTLSAGQVAGAIGRGAGPGTDLCPVADGGEGTMELLVGSLGGELVPAAAHDALGRPVSCRYGLIDGGRTAVVEAAEASGLWRLTRGEMDPLRCHTGGTGELIAAAIEAGAETVLVACGGSATVDGGSGARLREAGLVITGEGRLDSGTLSGKAVFEVATRARQAGVPCHAIAGRDELAPFEQRMMDLASVYEAGDPDAIAAAAREIVGFSGPPGC